MQQSNWNFVQDKSIGAAQDSFEIQVAVHDASSAFEDPRAIDQNLPVFSPPPTTRPPEMDSPDIIGPKSPPGMSNSLSAAQKVRSVNPAKDRSSTSSVRLSAEALRALHRAAGTIKDMQVIVSQIRQNERRSSQEIMHDQARKEKAISQTNERVEMLERHITNMKEQHAQEVQAMRDTIASFEEQHAQEVQTMRDTIASFEERIKDMKLAMDQMASIPAVTEAPKNDETQKQISSAVRIHLEEFYAKHFSDRMDQVDYLVPKFEGREEDLACAIETQHDTTITEEERDHIDQLLFQSDQTLAFQVRLSIGL